MYKNTSSYAKKIRMFFKNISSFKKKNKTFLKNELMLFTNFCKLNNFSANHQDTPSPEIKLQPDRHT
jgi:hypothetical protein